VACREFDGQVVRLEQIKELADKFVRVRLTRIDDLDLNLFEFDYDCTFMVFFLNAQEKVYARYGGRDADGPDSRQSLAGLQYTMESVLKMHERKPPAFAPKSQESPKYIREVAGLRTRGCMHCHQVKETLNADLQRKGKWVRDLVWRYPLPENLGIKLEIDRGNVIETVREESPAAAAGLKPGDVVKRIGRVPVHSFADAQFALDKAPARGTLEIAWQHGESERTDKLNLPENWRRSDISWRPSMHRLVPAARLYGDDLTEDEKKSLGLPAKQLAFKQKNAVPSQAKAAGIQGGDIIIGVDGRVLEMDANGFVRYVERNYVIGDRVTVNVLRDGKRLDLKMTLVR
jgi:serine protease Do